MTKISSVGICKNCTRTFQDTEQPCPYCGSTNRDISVTITDAIKLKDNIGLKKYKNGIKKFLVHLKKGWFSSKDKAKYPEGVYLHQEVDRENNFYKKEVIDAKTDQRIKDIEEPLDQHISV